MPKFRPAWLLLVAVCTLAATAAEKPDFSLANPYDAESTPLHAYWMSEKYDGARALWDGEKLVSRGGNAYAAPAWFTADFPTVQMDGELWLGRGRFEETMSIIRRQTPHAGWRAIRYMVFDLPAHPGTFRERYAALRTLRAAGSNPYWQVVEQTPVPSAAALEEAYQAVLAGGGEGVMLRRADSLHAGGRSDDLLKVKPFADAEAVVVAHLPGKGKYAGQTGALRVRTPDGVEFRLGSGLTDALRAQPPPVGSTVTYRFQGMTRHGKPRFPVFLRLRRDEQGAHLTVPSASGQ